MNRKIDRLVSKFKNGKERYHKSALFNTTIMSLAQGDDPLVLIDQLIEMTENVQKNMEEYIKTDTRQMVVRVETIGEEMVEITCPECGRIGELAIRYE